MKIDILSKKNNMKVLSLVLAVVMVFFEVSCRTAFASGRGEFPACYGSASDDNEFYVWHRVKDLNKPMYEYLSDYQNADQKGKDEYLNGKKTFRVMVANEFKEYDLSSKTIGGSEGKSGSWSQQLQGKYNYDIKLYYQADFTKLLYNTFSHVGDSVVSTELNPQVQIGEDTFITRGAQRAFISQYNRAGAGKYRFMYSDATDREPFATLSYVVKYTAKILASTYIYAFDDKGEPWGSNKSGDGDIFSGGKNTKSYIKNDGGKVIEEWKVEKGSENGTMRIVAENDDCLYVEYTGDLRIGSITKYENKRKRADLILYVGEPCADEVFQSLTGKSNTSSLDKETVRTINRPTYLRKDAEYIVEEDAVLFVDSVLVVNGKLTNKGKIVVDEGGAIVSWESGLGSISNCGLDINGNTVGGDLIVRKGSFVFVSTIGGVYQQMILYAPIYGFYFNITGGVIEYKNSSAKLGTAKNMASGSFIKATDNKGKVDVSFIFNNAKVSGSGFGIDTKDVIVIKAQ